MTKLSRRKYGDLVKFFRSVIKNESISLRVRMQAAERLDGIYSRHEAPELKRLEREAKAGAGDKPDTVTGTPGSEADVPTEPTPTESAQERARKFLESLSAGKEGNQNG